MVKCITACKTYYGVRIRMEHNGVICDVIDIYWSQLDNETKEKIKKVNKSDEVTKIIFQWMRKVLEKN
jgi:hypothetical protein